MPEHKFFNPLTKQWFSRNVTPQEEELLNQSAVRNNFLREEQRIGSESLLLRYGKPSPEQSARLARWQTFGIGPPPDRRNKSEYVAWGKQANQLADYARNEPSGQVYELLYGKARPPGLGPGGRGMHFLDRVNAKEPDSAYTDSLKSYGYVPFNPSSPISWQDSYQSLKPAENQWYKAKQAENRKNTMGSLQDSFQETLKSNPLRAVQMIRGYPGARSYSTNSRFI